MFIPNLFPLTCGGLPEAGHGHGTSRHHPGVTRTASQPPDCHPRVEAESKQKTAQ